MPRVRCFSCNRQALPTKRVPLDLRFSQGELAQKINAALGKLESVGAIWRTLDRLSCDPAKLAEIARQDDV